MKMSSGLYLYWQVCMLKLVWCFFFAFSFWSTVVCFFSLLRFVIEEDFWLAASSAPSRHHIGWTRWNGDTTSKNKLFVPTSFGRDRSQGICWVCDLQVLKDIWRHFTTDVSYFRSYAETKNNGGERKACVKWIQFRSWFKSNGAKVSNFIIQKFSDCFSLSFNVSVDVVPMLLSCSMIMIFPWLLK